MDDADRCLLAWQFATIDGNTAELLLHKFETRFDDVASKNFRCTKDSCKPLCNVQADEAQTHDESRLTLLEARVDDGVI